MSANLEQIVNPLPFVLSAWKRILENAGHTVYSVAAFDEGLNESKKSPYIDIKLSNLRAEGQEYPVSMTEKYWSSWEASLDTRAATMRGKNGDKHILMVGGIYVQAARYRQLFGPSVLPYHRLLHMRPIGHTPDTNGLLDLTEISFEIKIEARDDAWPTA